MVVSASTTVLADSIIRLRTTSSMARTAASKEAVVCALLVPARASPVPSVVPPPFVVKFFSRAHLSCIVKF